MTSERFIDVYEATARINRERLERLDAILAELSSWGIEALPLKGVDLLGRAYGGVLGLRPMVDVDLLFRGEDRSRIERILKAKGFRQRVDGNPSYLSADRVLSLDMVSEIWYRNDVDAVFERAVPRQVAGQLRPAMHPEDALVYLVAYQTLHRGRLGLPMANDLAAFLEAEGELIDWRNVVEQVTRYHLQLPVYHGLAYARDAGGAKVPPWVFDELRPLPSQRRIARLYRRLVSERGIPEIGHLLILLTRPGLKNKLLAGWHVFFPSRDFLTFRYGRTSWWRRLGIRLARPAHLVFRGSILFFRMGYRLLATDLAARFQNPAPRALR